MSEQVPELTTEAKAERAAAASLSLASSSNDLRTDALIEIANTIDGAHDAILEANATDVREAEKLLDAGEYSQALVDRLKLSTVKLESISQMVRSVANQTDPLGRTQSARELDTDLTLYRQSVPIGVVGSIFESRPDALVQIAALCLKSGNGAILKGGSEALETNRVLFECIREATANLPDGWVQLIEAREDVDELLGMDEYVDLIMPRGSSRFVRYIQEHTNIPVLGHAEGICHVYVDRDADLEMAAEIAYDAKVQYPAVCNAVETLLVHEDVADRFLPNIVSRYEQADVDIRGDQATRNIVDVSSVTEADWTTEYGDLIIAIRVVDDLETAMNHIIRFGSKHTDTIVTSSTERAHRFMRNLDSASVFHNASTRFADGYRYGLGAEVGISTGKTHARGPVGLEGLTTYQYYLEGAGHVVADYVGEDARAFSHEAVDREWPVE